MQVGGWDDFECTGMRLGGSCFTLNKWLRATLAKHTDLAAITITRWTAERVATRLS